MLLYDKIYQTALKNMTSAGMKFSYDQKAFESILYKNPDLISIKEFEMLTEEKDFLTAVYLRLLNRIPDEKVKRRYKNLIQKKQLDLANYIFFCSLTKSAEFKKLNKTVTGLKELKDQLYEEGVRYIGIIPVWEELKGWIWRFLHTYPFRMIWSCLSDDMKEAICVMLGWR